MFGHYYYSKYIYSQNFITKMYRHCMGMITSKSYFQNYKHVKTYNETCLLQPISCKNFSIHEQEMQLMSLKRAISKWDITLFGFALEMSITFVQVTWQKDWNLFAKQEKQATLTVNCSLLSSIHFHKASPLSCNSFTIILS